MLQGLKFVMSPVVAALSTITGLYLGCVTTARAAVPEAVTINTSMTIFTPPVRVELNTAQDVATVILLPGGNGLLGLDAGGVPTALSGNFLIRSANEFLIRGINVMMADSAPAFPTGIGYTTRLGATHAGHLQGFINAAAARWGKPVWIVGTSNGSVSAVTAAGFAPALTGFAGIVLTSSASTLSGNFTTSPLVTNQQKFDSYKVAITKPTLVVWHNQDACSVSLPAGSLALFNAIPAAIKSSQIATGGHSVATDVCGGASWHGYAGVEPAAVAGIVAYIRQVSGVTAPAAPPPNVLNMVPPSASAVAPVSANPSTILFSGDDAVFFGPAAKRPDPDR